MYILTVYSSQYALIRILEHSGDASSLRKKKKKKKLLFLVLYSSFLLHDDHGTVLTVHNWQANNMISTGLFFKYDPLLSNRGLSLVRARARTHTQTHTHTHTHKYACARAILLLVK